MRYMLFTCDDGTSADADAGTSPDLGAWLDRVAELGADRRGWRLRPADEAVTVRVRDGRTLVTSGPADAAYAPVDGVEILECPDLDAAIELAGAHPAGRRTVEIRPFWEES